MKRLLLLAFAVFFIQISYAQNNLSNKGKEFWVGYGHNTLFTAVSNSQTFVLYLSATAAANVTVSCPGNGWTTTVAIPANTVNSAVIVPKSGTTDCRLLSEGLSNKGIHIVSDTPIVAYAHQYGTSSSGATMLMPVETYGYTYYSLNYSQLTNSTPAYSWFYVVASEDNTTVEITPSANTLLGSPAGASFSVSLNKGQIYNVFGQSSGTSGVDLTGSKIKSVAGSDNKCHPIAVFSGSSRIIICGTSGGDVMQQQIFPASAWGTKYATYPTVRAGSPSSTNVNFYRIAVRDPLTVVKKNGVTLTNLINNFYYEYSSNAGDYIESNKPILVAQYMPSQDGCSGYTGNGDPEMFYLSPLEQAISSATFYNTGNQLILNNYVSIIVKGFNVASAGLTIDGSSTFDYTTFHPQLAGYTIAVKSLSSGQHTIQSNNPFTAITYGMGSAESYGYNAGTLVNNLNSVPQLINTLNTTASTTNYTCRNTPVNFSIKTIYQPSQIIWKFTGLGSIISPNPGDITISSPTPTTVYVDPATNITYYTYSLSGTYQFNTLGIHHIPVVITAPEVDNCSNTETIDYAVDVRSGAVASFTSTYSGCVSDVATFNGSTTTPGANISQYLWNFTEPAGTATGQTTNYTFNASGNHNVGLHLVTTDGCVGDTVFQTVVTNPSPIATFGVTPNQACFNGAPVSVAFSDTSSFGASPITNYYWDFGDPASGAANTSTLQNPTHTYSTPGTYNIQHYAGGGSCNSATKTKTFTILDLPLTDFTFPDECLQDSTLQFTNTTTISDGQALTYAWDFGDPASGAANTSTLQNPTHKFVAYGTYQVKLTVTTAFGCSKQIIKPYTVKGYTTTVNYSVENEASLCAQNAVKLTNLMDVATNGISRIDIYWDYANNPTVFETDNSPAANEIYTHNYTDFKTPAQKNAVIKWVVYSTGPCESTSEKTITLNASPQIAFGPVISGFCINATTGTIAGAAVTNGLAGTGIYSGTGVGATGNFNPATAGVGGPYNIKYVFTSSVGCKDSATATIKVFAKPAADFTIDRTVICAKDSVLLTATSTLSAGTIASHQWDFGDATNAVKLNANPFYHAYLNTGSPISIKYKAISDSGCISDEITKTVTVNSLPVASFTAGTQNCGSTSITYTPTSTSPGLIAWNWNLDEGQTFNNTTNAPVTGSYATAGPKTVTHTVSAGPGCVSDPVTQTVTIFAGIVPKFRVDNVCLAADSLTSFINESSSPDGQTLTYVWNFDDPASGVNNTSTLTNPTHKFSDYNVHNVTLTVTGAANCPSPYTLQYKVRGFAPGINFTVANEANLCVQNAVSVTNNMNITADSVYRIDMYWDFANNPTVFTQVNNPAQNGVYTNSYADFISPATKTITIKWIVYSKGQCPNEFTKTITLNATPDVALSSVIPGVCFNATGIVINAASVTNVTGTGVYSGTGVSANGAFDPSVAGVGPHTITYTFTSGSGCTATKTATINVFPQPTASFTATSNICETDSILFTNSSTIASGNITTWNWVYGDNGTTVDPKNNGAAFYHTYNTYGSFNPSLTVVSDSGCVSAPYSLASPVVIKANPVAAFTLPAAVCLPLAEAKFTNQSTLPGGSATALTYQWNFGEPASSTNTSTATDPTHYYNSTGTGPYTVQLVAENNGCTDTLVQTLSAIYQQPIAKFGKDAVNGCSDKPITFTDSSTAPGSTISIWSWTFNNTTTGNITSASTQNPVRLLPSGNYTVSLVATSAVGCVSNQADSTNIIVYLQPVIDAGANILTEEFVSVPLKATSNSTSFDFKWTPATYLSNDDILNPTVITPEFNQVYKLTAIGDGGCTATDSVKVTVLKTLNIPTAFSPNGDGINDTYKVPYLEDYPGATVEIFNRYGQSVWRESGGKPWDGKLNGKVLPMGVYYYLIQPKNKGYGKLSGNITILY